MTLNILMINDHQSILDGYLSYQTLLDNVQLFTARDEKSALEILARENIKTVYCDTSIGGKDLGPQIGVKINETYPDIVVIGTSTDTEKAKLWEPNFKFEYQGKLLPQYFMAMDN